MQLNSVSAHASGLMEQVLYEVKRVVVGQDVFLERVMVAMLAQGHLLALTKGRTGQTYILGGEDVRADVDVQHRVPGLVRRVESRAAADARNGVRPASPMATATPVLANPRRHADASATATAFGRAVTRLTGAAALLVSLLQLRTVFPSCAETG